MKAKEPLLAVFLTFVFPGLGHIYSGRMKRGLILIGVMAGFLILAILCCLYSINPINKITLILVILYGILLVLSILFEVFLYIDSYLCARAFNLKNNLTYKNNFWKILLLIIAVVLFNVILKSPKEWIAVYVKNNYYQAFKIPAHSMEPTLQVGDRILGDKSYIKKNRLQRGDLIVFKFPDDPTRNFVKRLIAFGGETVEIKGGHIYINGKLTDNLKINKLQYLNHGDYGNFGSVVSVPAGHYYVLGDHSSESNDSRFWGFVPEQNVLAKVTKIYWPMERSGPVE